MVSRKDMLLNNNAEKQGGKESYKKFSEVLSRLEEKQREQLYFMAVGMTYINEVTEEKKK